VAIRSLSDRAPRKIEIDLTGPEGNAYALLNLAERLGRTLGYDKRRIELILDEMRLSTYEGLLHTFDREFGVFVDLYR
jgi:hypothetical protein